MKTHCFCYKGNVISYRTKNGTLVDGHALSTRSGKNSNINVLYKIDQNHVNNPVTYAWNIVSLCNKVGSGKAIMQRYEYFKKQEYSNIRKIKKNKNISPSIDQGKYVEGDINLAYPRLICDMCIKFIEKLNILFPGISSDDTIVYAPTLQWGIAKIDMNHNMESTVPNLYVVGDCAGITQGIVVAAISGVVASRDIICKCNGGMENE